MSGRYEFSIFVFDSETAELTRNGRKLHLAEQTSRVLTILLEQAGTLVTREELQNLMWPDGEFLDRDNAMNKAIHQLRTVLRDAPKSPQFIETIPKRGYRFRPEVTLLPPVAPKVLRNGISGDHQQAEPSTTHLMLPPESVQAVNIEIGPKYNIPSLPHDPEEHRSPFFNRVISGKADLRKHPWVLGFGLALVLLISISVIAVHKPQVAHGADARYLSIGIPPFDAQGPGAEQLSESFRFDLTDALSHLPEVQVRAARSFAGSQLNDANIPQLSRTLHLDVLLLGKFVLRGKLCVLQLELVRGSDATHLASFEYSGSEDELTTIRDKVQHDLFARFELTRNSTKPLGDTENPQAYKSYLMARDSASLRTPESLNKALQQYQQAIALDPAFAKAYAGMATAYMAISGMDPATPANVSLHKAGQFAAKALELDPMLAEAHAVLGNVSLHQDWNLPLGEKELRRAIELDPGKAVYHAWLAFVLTEEGHFDEGLAQINLAHSEDPLWPVLYGDEGFIAGCAHQNEQAIAAAQKQVELAPDFPIAHDGLANAFFVAGRYKDAIAQWRLVASMEKNAEWMALEDRGLSAFRRGGISAYAQVHLRAIESGIKTNQENDFVPAEWYAYTGNRDKAISFLEDMVRQHDPSVLDLAVNPMYDNLHRDSRFRAILSQVGLTLPTSYPKPELQASLR
jgi:DNA-binding winged helix-turn-helix (wHTH) protein/Tfp pilus assembly protein PilF/TolB-like protein